MKNDEVLAIADPKDRELVPFTVGETFDANVKVLQAVVPRPQSTGPREPFIVRRVCQGPPFREVAPRGSRGWHIAPHMGTPGGGCG